MGGSIQNLKVHEVFAHTNFSVPGVIERLRVLDHQASISASSTGRYQIDERNANEYCLDSTMVDEESSISTLQTGLYFPTLFFFALGKVITIAILYLFMQLQFILSITSGDEASSAC